MFLTLSVSALVVVPSLCYTFYHVMVVLIDIISSLITFYWNLLLFITGFIKEIIRIVGPVFRDVTPVFVYFARDMWTTVRGISLELWRNFQLLAAQGEEGLMLAWGTFVTFAYFYWNQILQIVRENNQRDENDIDQDNNERPNRNRLYPDLDEIDNYINNNRVVNNNIVDDNNRVDRNNTNENANGDDNAWMRLNDGLHQRRLYPQLDDNTPSGHGGGDIDNRRCVICFERDRNTAVFPCGHTHTCLQCTLAITRRTGLCPMCQQRIREHRRIFV